MKEDLPRWLYELLPSLYIAVGLGCAVLLSGPFAKISAVLLVCAGLLVHDMRRRYRRHERLRLAGRTALRRRSPAGGRAANT